MMININKPSLTQRLRERYYAGDRYNGTLIFYNWIRQYTSPYMHALNIGAGPPAQNPIRILKGEVAEVIGIDIDACVLLNPELDRASLIVDGLFPVPDASIDLAWSDYVLEHVESPQQFLREVHRVLKPGGQFFFRTPNIYHYVAAVSALTPHSFHARIANPVRQNAPDTHEPWPTFYRMNSRRALIRESKNVGFGGIELRMIETEPSYLKFSAVPFLAGIAYERIVNSTGALASIRANIFGRLQK